MKNNKRKSGISIDSEKDIRINGDVVGGNKIINFSSNSSEHTQNKLMECPICGQYNDQQKSFRCFSCNREFICLSHRDNKGNTCINCFDNCKGLVEVFYLRIETAKVKFDSETWDSAKRKSLSVGDLTDIAVRSCDVVNDSYLFTSTNSFNSRSWASSFGYSNHPDTKLERFTIEKVQANSSGRIYVDVKEYWDKHRDPPEYEPTLRQWRDSRITTFQLIFTENGIMKIESVFSRMFGK